jgi:hypothetical protein
MRPKRFYMSEMACSSVASRCRLSIAHYTPLRLGLKARRIEDALCFLARDPELAGRFAHRLVFADGAGL